MYFSEYDFDVEYEDFQEAEYDFVCGSLSYHAGDLVFGDFEDGTVFVLKKLPN